MRKGMISALMGAAALSMMLATTGCGGGGGSDDGAKDTVKKFVKAAKEGRITAVRTMYVKSLQGSDNTGPSYSKAMEDMALIDTQMGAKDPEDEKVDLALDGDPDKLEPTNITYMGSKDNNAKELCKIDCKLSYKGSKNNWRNKVTFMLVMEDGQWKVLDVGQKPGEALAKD